MPLTHASTLCTPLPLTATQERILQAVATLRVATAQEITHMLFAKGSASYVRHLLCHLAGGSDFCRGQFLYRVPLPSETTGTKARVYTLGVKGRQVLLATGYYRPYKLRHRSFSHLMHDLTLSRLLAAAIHCWRTQATYQLGETRLCYEFAGRPPTVTLVTEEKESAVVVIPDAWVVVERLADGKAFPLWIEIDRGTEYRLRFQQLVSARLAFIRSGQYETVFGTPAIRMVYLTSGLTPKSRYTRLNTMRRWTEAVLPEQDREAWSSLFRFTAIVFETMYDQVQTLLSEPVWFKPIDSEPLPLFDPIPPQEQSAASAGKEHTDGEHTHLA